MFDAFKGYSFKIFGNENCLGAIEGTSTESYFSVRGDTGKCDLDMKYALVTSNRVRLLSIKCSFLEAIRLTYDFRVRTTQKERQFCYFFNPA